MRTRAATFLLGALLAFPALAYADPVELSTSELIAMPPSEETLEVTMQGEAITAALRSEPGHRFVNLLQDGTAVGVWMTEEDAELIDGFGRYGRIGTVLRVDGVLNVVCAQHGGDLDVHAGDVSVVSPSRLEPARPVPTAKWVMALGGMAAVVALWALYSAMKRRAFIGE